MYILYVDKGKKRSFNIDDNFKEQKNREFNK